MQQISIVGTVHPLPNVRDALNGFVVRKMVKASMVSDFAF